MPGFTGSKEDFAPLLDLLSAAGHGVVALDQRGQYESPGPAPETPEDYTVAALAAALAAVIDVVAGPAGTVHLVGHSFGGLVARAAVLADPARVASLTLLGSGPAALHSPRTDQFALLAPILAAGGMPAVHAALQQLDAADPRAVALPPALQDFLRVRFLASSGVGLQGMADALVSEPDRIVALRDTGVPVLVAHGAGDDAWSPDVQAEMAERLGARYVVIADAEHSPALDNPAATARALTEFWT